MKEKRGWKELLKNNFISLVFVISLILMSVVIAGNVIVKEGAMDVSQNLNVSGNVTTIGVIQTPTIQGGASDNDNISIKGTSSVATTESYLKLQENGGRVIVGEPSTSNRLSVMEINSGSNSETRTIGLMLKATTPGSRPGFRQECLPRTTGGVAFPLMSAYLGYNESNKILAGTIGVLGSTATPTSSVSYLYMGSEPTASYINNTLRLYPNKIAEFDYRLTIGQSGSYTPVSTLDVNGNATIRGYINFTGNLFSDDNAFYFNGNSHQLWLGKNTSIFDDGTNTNFITNRSGGSGLAWFSNNVSATGYLTRTSIYDKSRGEALDYVKDAETYRNPDGSIDHQAFYGSTNYQVTDYSKPVEVKYTETICTDTTNYPDLTNGGIEQEIAKTQDCKDIEKTKIIYPYTKTEEAVDLGKEIDVLRQSVYELKTELCNYNKGYSWC